MNDLKFAFRQLARNPGFTAVALLTLALGIGINASMFSTLKEFLFAPLPFPDPGRLALVSVMDHFSQNAADYFDEREQAASFSHLGAFRNWLENANLASPGISPQGVHTLRTTGSFFATLGVSPLLGRTYTEEDDQPGRGDVVVLSRDFWLERFRGDTNIVGGTLKLNGASVTVIGVMPARFACPLLFNGQVDLWQPLAMTAETRRDRLNEGLNVIGRLKPGVPLAQAQAEMTAIGDRLKKDYPNPRPRLFRLRTGVLGQSLLNEQSRLLFWLLFGLTGFVLLIACANLANLQLARTAGRARELGIRASLGAGRARLARQLLTESVILSLLGAVLGLAFAAACNRVLSHQFVLHYDLQGFEVSVNRTVLGFTALVGLLTGILVGLAPAWLLARGEANLALKENAQSFSAGRLRGRLQNAFVAVQVALAVSLLASAGEAALVLRREALRRNAGWRPEGLVAGQMALLGPAYDSTEKCKLFGQRLEEEMAALPGVTSVSVTSELPFQTGSCWHVIAEGRPESDPDQRPLVFWHNVDANFFKTMGMTLRQGRGFTPGEMEKDAPVIVVNQTMADELWPGTNAIGKRVAWVGTQNWLEIIGVVNDLSAARGCHAYRTAGMITYLTVAARSTGALGPIVPALRQTVARIDPDLPVLRIESASQAMDQAQTGGRMITRLVGAFGFLGLLLAAIGVYGVTHHSVARRTTEFGIRMALGARRSDVLALVLRGGLRTSLLGATAGVAGGVAILRIFKAVLNDGSAADPIVFAGVSAAGWTATVAAAFVLILVALLACWLPARRAANLDPMEALRYE
jgi:predicted permease